MNFINIYKNTFYFREFWNNDETFLYFHQLNIKSEINKVSNATQWKNEDL